MNVIMSPSIFHFTLGFSAYFCLFPLFWRTTIFYCGARERDSGWSGERCGHPVPSNGWVWTSIWTWVKNTYILYWGKHLISTFRVLRPVHHCQLLQIQVGKRAINCCITNFGANRFVQVKVWLWNQSLHCEQSIFQQFHFSTSYGTSIVSVSSSDI